MMACAFCGADHRHCRRSPGPSTVRHARVQELCGFLISSPNQKRGHSSISSDRNCLLSPCAEYRRQVVPYSYCFYAHLAAWDALRCAVSYMNLDESLQCVLQRGVGSVLPGLRFDLGAADDCSVSGGLDAAHFLSLRHRVSAVPFLRAKRSAGRSNLTVVVAPCFTLVFAPDASTFVSVFGSSAISVCAE